MRGNELLDKMELINSAYIEAADKNQKNNKKFNPSVAKNIKTRWVAIVACLCLIITGFALMQKTQNTSVPSVSNPSNSNPNNLDSATSNSTELKPIEIPELLNLGSGFEAYMCYDVSELANGNPWSESMNISTMPVYKNATYDPLGTAGPQGLTESQMKEKLNLTASLLNLKIKNSVVEIKRVCAETNNGSIEVHSDGHIRYFLSNDGLKLPDKYSFTYCDTTEDQAKDVLSYLIDSYNNILNFKKPTAITYGDYNIYAKINRKYQVYDSDEDDLQDILNYNFNRACFAPNDNGNLYIIDIFDKLAASEKLGDYPIITVKEATERFFAGKYQTSVPEEVAYNKVTKELIGRVELVYRAEYTDELFLPYYRFYVELPYNKTEKTGLKRYGAYYVPAITDEYIIDMPTYDGSFN